MQNLFLKISVILLSCQVHAQDYILKIGERLRLPAPTSAAVQVGARSILRVIDGQNHIDVIALKVGATDLIVGHKTHHVVVTLVDQKNFVLQLQNTLLQLRGLKSNMQYGKVRVEGTLLRFEDWLELSELSARTQGEYEMNAQPLPDVGKQAFTHFQNLFSQAGLPVVHLLQRPTWVAEVGKVSSEIKAQYQKILRPFGVGIETDNSQLAVAPMISTRVILAEVSKSQAREFGLIWPNEYQGQLLPKLSGPQDLLARLRALEQSGEAQVLAAPNLLCRSGSEARFHAGGTFPILARGRRSQSVTWKPHGVLLRVRPQADRKGHISLDLETEISMIDPSHSVEGIPALKTNSVTSQFNLYSSKTVALSGLLRRESGYSVDGLPWLSRMPVLGPLFSSHLFQEQQSELVIFVTPEIQE